MIIYFFTLLLFSSSYFSFLSILCVFILTPILLDEPNKKKTDAPTVSVHLASEEPVPNRMITRSERDNVTLKCRATAKPAVDSYAWFKNVIFQLANNNNICNNLYYEYMYIYVCSHGALELRCMRSSFGFPFDIFVSLSLSLRVCSLVCRRRHRPMLMLLHHHQIHNDE